MVRQRYYNLRPRTKRNITPRKAFPKPQIGDDITISWETLKKKYDGRLARFDDGEKTFLVDYDEIPDGYDCSRIWENLDYVSWRFLNRFEKPGSHRTGMCTRRSCRIREGESYGPVDGERRSEWFDPGDLSAAYPEFDSQESAHWNRRKKKKKTRKSYDDHHRDPEKGNTGRSVENSAHTNGLLRDSKNDNQSERGEMQVAATENTSFQETSRAANSSEGQRSVSGIQRPKKRTYADFRALEFKSMTQHASSAAGHASDHINSAPCYALKTNRVNFSRNIEVALRHRRVELNETQQPCFTVRTGQHLSNKLTSGESESDSPSVEEQIRSITRSMGLSD